jgi:hypothetical protein
MSFTLRQPLLASFPLEEVLFPCSLVELNPAAHARSEQGCEQHKQRQPHATVAKLKRHLASGDSENHSRFRRAQKE